MGHQDIISEGRRIDAENPALGIMVVSMPQSCSISSSGRAANLRRLQSLLVPPDRRCATVIGAPNSPSF